MKWADFEKRVRDSVDDAITDHDDSSATHTIEEIARYTNTAIRDYSHHFPRQRTHTINVATGTKEYDLPSDILTPPDMAIVDARWDRTSYERDHLQYVRWPAGRKETISLSGTGLGYTLWAEQFILMDEPTARDASYDIVLWYNAVHETVPEEKGEPLYSRELTVPEADIDLLFWYVTSLCMAKLEASDADLRRWAERDDGGIYRDDSPPRKSARFRMGKYEDGVTLRKAGKRAPRLHRTRR